MTASRSIRLLAACAGAALLVSADAASAADPVDADGILRALTTPKKPLTRSLSSPRVAADPAETKFVDSLRGRRTRSLSSGEREQIAAIAKDKPAIDLEINFEYKSDVIAKSAEPSVAALGKALTDPSLKGATFVLAGHTDAVGGEDYNQDLSERRAEAIKRVLTDRYGIAGSDLVTVGYGKSKLKDAAHPTAAANRRVQVVNMATQSEAAK